MGRSSLALYPWAVVAGDAGVPSDGSGFRGVSLHHTPDSREAVDQIMASAAKAGGSMWGGRAGRTRLLRTVNAAQRRNAMVNDRAHASRTERLGGFLLLGLAALAVAVGRWLLDTPRAPAAPSPGGRSCSDPVPPDAEEPMADPTPYRLKADSVEACNCELGCNCQFKGYPNEGFCEFLIGYEVKEGRYGDVDLAGLRAVVAMKYPKAIHEGDGHVLLFVDEDASDEQTEAFVTIVSGEAGGMPWEALAGTMSRFEGPVRKPIDVAFDGLRSRIEVQGAAELQASPLRNPVSGEENEVHITYPKGGFMWDDGNVATTETMRVDYGDLQLEWPGKYAAVAEVNWTNQG